MMSIVRSPAGWLDEETPIRHATLFDDDDVVVVGDRQCEKPANPFTQRLFFSNSRGTYTNTHTPIPHRNCRRNRITEEENLPHPAPPVASFSFLNTNSVELGAVWKRVGGGRQEQQQRHTVERGVSTRRDACDPAILIFHHSRYH